MPLLLAFAKVKRVHKQPFWKYPMKTLINLFRSLIYPTRLEIQTRELELAKRGLIDMQLQKEIVEAHESLYIKRIARLSAELMKGQS